MEREEAAAAATVFLPAFGCYDESVSGSLCTTYTYYMYTQAKCMATAGARGLWNGKGVHTRHTQHYLWRIGVALQIFCPISQKNPFVLLDFPLLSLYGLTHYVRRALSLCVGRPGHVEAPAAEAIFHRIHLNRRRGELNPLPSQ